MIAYIIVLVAGFILGFYAGNKTFRTRLNSGVIALVNSLKGKETGTRN